MHRANRVLKETSNSRTYKGAILWTNGSCPVCGLGKGHNRNRTYRYKTHSNWKRQRKTQYKNSTYSLIEKALLF